MRDLLTLVFVLSMLTLLTASCSSTYTPTLANYQREINTMINKHEDFILVNYGKPDEILLLAEGTKALVYRALPYKSSPITDNAHKTCRTVFAINEELRVQYIRAQGNFCVK